MFRYQGLFNLSCLWIVFVIAPSRQFVNMYHGENKFGLVEKMLMSVLNNKEIYIFINFTIGTIYLNVVLLFSNKNVDIKCSAHDSFLE
jgi:hypothetical protein